MTSKPTWLAALLCVVVIGLVGSSTSAQDTPAPKSPVEQLVAGFGYTADALENIDDVRVEETYALDTRAKAAARITAVEPTLARLQERARLLSEFAEEQGLDELERNERVRRLAIAEAQVATTTADVDALQQAVTSLDQEGALLGEVLGVLEEQQSKESQRTAEQAQLQTKLAKQEDEARQAAEEARKREEATNDEALRQLYAREREVRDELLKIATARREESELAAKSQMIADEFTAKKGEILGHVDALPPEPTHAQQLSQVDPLLHEILIERRQLWAKLSNARAAERKSADAVSEAEGLVEEAAQKVADEKGRERELGGGALWKQRVKVAETELELEQGKLDSATQRSKQATAQVALLVEGVEFFSKELRAVVGRASGTARNEVYGLLNVAAWDDAFQRLNDKLQAAGRLFASRAEAGRSLADQWLQLGLWVGGLAWRVFLALLLTLTLRFVPVITRRVLDFLQGRKFFRRRASLAVKIFEVLRTAARPGILYGGATYVTAYVTNSFAELVFIQWAVDAFFVYLIGVRIAATLALPRWYREREGLATTGGENDLRSDEAAIADLMRLDLDRGTKFVRSARIVILVGTVWFFAPSIVVGITGVSVLSGLITNLTRLAILVVVFWMLSTWRNELSRLFTRLAGDRLPKATAFVEGRKDKWYGVIVVALVSVVVIGWEIVKFVRRAVLSTVWFKRLSAYIFKTKIELQQRDEPSDAELSAFLPDDLEAAFGPGEVCGTPRLIERQSMIELREQLREFTARGHGAICVVGEPGSGKTVTCQWLVEGREVVTLDLTGRIRESGDILAIFDAALNTEFTSLDALVEHLHEAPSRIFVIDGLEHTFLRDIDGYGAYRTLMEVIHRLNRVHVWVVAANRFAWEFLTRVYDQRHVFQVISTIPRWTDEELRELVERRMVDLPYTTSFTELADLDAGDSAEVVKTARGYYRYLAEFTRGNPATAMYYWLRSLSGGSRQVYSVGLFTRPTGAALLAAPTEYRFVLAAITQHGILTPDQAARVGNTPVGTCELAAEYFSQVGAIVGDIESGFRLSAPFLSVTLRHLEDANLL